MTVEIDKHSCKLAMAPPIDCFRSRALIGCFRKVIGTKDSAKGVGQI